MIECNINKKEDRIQVAAADSAKDLMVETAVLIQQIFRGIDSQCPEAAQEYKYRLLGTLLDPNSPVWKEK